MLPKFIPDVPGRCEANLQPLDACGGCAKGTYCTVCKTLSGPKNTCMPNGSAC